MDNLVEVIEEYEGGVLIRRKVDGVYVDLPPFENCKSVTFIKTMSQDEAQRMYGFKLKAKHL